MNTFSSRVTFDTSSGPAGFNVLLSAMDVSKAIQRLREILTEIKRTSDAFGDATEVFLSEMVELPSVPEGGVVLHFEQLTGDEGISHRAALKSMPGQQIYHYRKQNDQSGEDLPIVRFQ